MEGDSALRYIGGIDNEALLWSVWFGDKIQELPVCIDSKVVAGMSLRRKRRPFSAFHIL
jgi:hypothetical protein